MASGSARTSSNGSAGRYQMPLFTSSRGLCMLVLLERPDNLARIVFSNRRFHRSVALYWRAVDWSRNSFLA